MSFTIALPSNVPQGFGVGFSQLLAGTGAIPFEVGKVTTIGVAGKGIATQMPSVVDFKGAGESAKLSPYEGSQMLGELLDSTPRTLKRSLVPLEDRIDDHDDVFAKAAEDESMTVRKLLSLYRGKPEAKVLARRYRKASLLTENFTNSIYRMNGESDHEASEFLSRLSPTALVLAGQRAPEWPKSGLSPYAMFAKYSLLFISGAFAAVCPDVDSTNYAIDSMREMNAFFEEGIGIFEDGEDFKISATLNEILAELMVRNEFEKTTDGRTAADFRSEAASLWISVLEALPDDQNFEGIFLRAINHADIMTQPETVERIFRVGLRRQGSSSMGTVQYLLRTAWAIIHNDDERRPHFGVWEQVESILGDLGEILSGGEIAVDGSYHRVISGLRAEAARIAAAYRARGEQSPFPPLQVFEE